MAVCCYPGVVNSIVEGGRLGGGGGGGDGGWKAVNIIAKENLLARLT